MQRMWEDCHSSSPRSLSEQWHHCRTVWLWHYQMCGEDCGQRAEEWRREQRAGERGRVQNGGRNGWIDRDSGSVRERARERGNKKERASSCGLAELTVNLGRFIFSGACCSLDGARRTCLTLGRCRARLGGAEGQSGGISGVTEVTQSRLVHGVHSLIHYLPFNSPALGFIRPDGAFQPVTLIRNTPSINWGVSYETLSFWLTELVWADGSLLPQLALCIPCGDLCVFVFLSYRGRYVILWHIWLV